LAATHVDHLLFTLVDEMHLIWDANPFLYRAQESAKEAIYEHATYNIAELDTSLTLGQEWKRSSKKKTTR